LYEVNEYNKTSRHIPDLARDLKSKLKELMVNMKKYMDDNKLREDIFMKMLTDDIFTAHTTFGTAHGHMYVASRQTSQATQGIHNNTVYNNSFQQQTQSHYYMPGLVPMTRGLTCHIQQMNEDDELDLALPQIKRGVTYQIQQMNEDDEFNLLKPPALSRGVSHYLHTMNEDEEDEEDEISRNPCDLVNCSMSAAVPKLKRSIGRSVGFSEVDVGILEEEDDVFSRHVTLESDVSPYMNLKTMTLMREVSFTPKKPEEEEEQLP
jgi:hypothetical protein